MELLTFILYSFLAIKSLYIIGRKLNRICNSFIAQSIEDKQIPRNRKRLLLDCLVPHILYQFARKAFLLCDNYAHYA